MLLDKREKEYLGKLEVGYGIVRLQGRWFSPFLVKFPLVSIKNGIVTDEMIRRNMRRYSGYSRGWSRDDRETTPIQDIPAQGRVSEEEKEYLIDILKNPLSGVVERNNRLKMSARKGNGLKELLMAKDLIETKEIGTGSGRVVLAQLTKEGGHVLGESRYESNNRTRQYGLTHEFWRDKVRRYYAKRGYKVTPEKRLNGERADLVAEKEKNKIAIEIETSSSNATRNIKKCLDQDFDLVISVPTSRQIETQIRERLTKESPDGTERVRVIRSDRFDERSIEDEATESHDPK